MKEKSDLKVKRDDKVEKKYTRTLQFIFIKATLDLYPNSKITIQHSIGSNSWIFVKRDQLLASRISKESGSRRYSGT